MLDDLQAVLHGGEAQPGNGLGVGDRFETGEVDGF
jgi:hypothetical protein